MSSKGGRQSAGFNKQLVIR